MAKYRRLAEAKVGDGRYLVVSERLDGMVSIAQKIVTVTDMGMVEMFLKNAIVTDLSGLIACANALTVAAEELAKQNKGPG